MSLQEVDKLSTQSYWDEVLKLAHLPRVNASDVYLYSVTMKRIDEAVKKGSYKTFFEVGCGSSGWLPYFANKYAFTVSGLDYSEIGCELARKNLNMLNIKYGQIFCQDFFQPDPTEGKSYDIVFSYGVIEHFNEPSKIIGIFNSFLESKGLMITLIPNFNGIIGRLTKYFIRDVYDIHNKISPKELESYHTDNSMEVVSNGYAGIFSLQVMPWIKSKRWIFREGTFRRKVALFVINALDKVMSSLFKLLPFDLPSRVFSPYLICIARKN